MRPELATLAEAASLAITRMLAATEAWLSGVADAVAEMEMAVEDMLGVVTEALEDTGAEEATDEETAEEEITEDGMIEDETAGDDEAT